MALEVIHTAPGLLHMARQPGHWQERGGHLFIIPKWGPMPMPAAIPSGWGNKVGDLCVCILRGGKWDLAQRIARQAGSQGVKGGGRLLFGHIVLECLFYQSSNGGGGGGG